MKGESHCDDESIVQTDQLEEGSSVGEDELDT